AKSLLLDQLAGRVQDVAVGEGGGGEGEVEALAGARGAAVHLVREPRPEAGSIFRILVARSPEPRKRRGGNREGPGACKPRIDRLARVQRRYPRGERLRPEEEAAAYPSSRLVVEP